MIRVDGESGVVAIVGDPIAQAKSPELFNALFERQAIHAVLVPFRVAANDLTGALDGLSRIGNLAGVILTVPHKRAGITHASTLTSQARSVGAVNCLRREADGTWAGAMFDGIGFVDGLLACGHAVRGKSALLVGAGGAGVAIAHALVDAGIASIDVFDSDVASLRHLIGALRERATNVVVSEYAACAGFTHDLVINATPCGMSADDPCPIDLAGANPRAVVADIIMKPAETRLLKEARLRGLVMHPGRHLLENSVHEIAAFLGLPVRPES
ncbi:shikimate dehydrogenase family protein [Paraburkholderia youngii]|uniref:shikimate dehydrogenase family protein n=1 Tax=Paraburkholderia youngii TaxID=2782701 RepID=UPI001595E077|nr:shikimate dehydrogenase [Paraburkholderia youngii]